MLTVLGAVRETWLQTRDKEETPGITGRCYSSNKLLCAITSSADGILNLTLTAGPDGNWFINETGASGSGVGRCSQSLQRNKTAGKKDAMQLGTDHHPPTPGLRAGGCLQPPWQCRMVTGRGKSWGVPAEATRGAGGGLSGGCSGGTKHTGTGAQGGGEHPRSCSLQRISICVCCW